MEWSDGRMTIDDPAPSRRFIGCEGRVLAVKSDDGEANLIYVIPDGTRG